MKISGETSSESSTGALLAVSSNASPSNVLITVGCEIVVSSSSEDIPSAPLLTLTGLQPLMALALLWAAAKPLYIHHKGELEIKSQKLVQ